MDYHGRSAYHWLAIGGHITLFDDLVLNYRKDRKYYRVCDGNQKAQPIHHAAASGQLAMVKHLEAQGVSLKEMDKIGATPLHYACHSGEAEVVSYLLASGKVTFATVDHQGFTPMDYAIRGNQVAIVSSYLTANDLAGGALLFSALSVGARDVAIMLLDKKCAVDHSFRDGQTCLMLACSRADEILFERLLQAGADKYAVDDHGRNVWFYAASSRKEAFLQILVKEGIPIANDHHGRSPLHVAVQTGRLKMVKALEDCGDVITPNDEQRLQELKKLAAQSATNRMVKGDDDREWGADAICRYLDKVSGVKRLQYQPSEALVQIKLIPKEGNSRPLKKKQAMAKKRSLQATPSVVLELFNKLEEDGDKRYKVEDEHADASLPATVPIGSL
ncbi:MAG: ankyrin repeat domain-containing protein, partial [Coxiellaceae bacterium]|nr:ankyrin repeat domain-containing protein [Coxiellaceae bacterium]